VGLLVPLSVAVATEWIWGMGLSARDSSFARSVFFWLSCPAFGMYEGAVLAGVASREDPIFVFGALCVYWVGLGFVCGVFLHYIIVRRRRAGGRVRCA
jgi:hypothetical protein